MIVLLLKQMHLQKDVAVDFAAMVSCGMDRRRRTMLVMAEVVDIDGRIVMYMRSEGIS